MGRESVIGMTITTTWVKHDQGNSVALTSTVAGVQQQAKNQGEHDQVFGARAVANGNIDRVNGTTIFHNKLYKVLVKVGRERGREKGQSTKRRQHAAVQVTNIAVE